MEIPLDEVVYFDAITSSPTTGAAADADSTPTFAVYEENTDTDIGVGGNLTKRTSLTGNYRGTFTASAANGFELGKWYSIIASATVGGIAGKAVVKNFRVVAAELVAGYRLDDVGKWLGGTIPAVGVTGVPLVDARYLIGTAFATPATAGVLDVNVKNMNNVAASSITTISANVGTTQPINFTGTAGSALAKSDMVDVAGAAVSTSTAQLGANVVQINGQTATAAAGVAFPSSIASPTNITAATGITVATNNDKTGYALSTGGVQAIWDALTSALTAVGSIGKRLADDIDATISSRSTYSGGAVASVTAGVTVTTNNDKTGYGLSTAAVQAVWDALTSALTTSGSIGKWILDKLDVVLSTRLASGSYTAPDNTTIGTINTKIGTPAVSVSADIAGVQSDTDNIQTRIPAALVSGRMDASVGAMATDTLTAAALASDAVTEIQTGLSTLTAAGIRTAVGLASANLDTQLSAIDDFLDTEIAAIKAKTDNLPASPAATGDIPTSSITAIKAKTDNLPADTGAEIDLIEASLTNIGDAINALPTAADNVAAYLDLADGVEVGLTPRQAFRLMAAAAAGKLSGAATTTIVIRNAAADSKNRITATCDADGNRSAITLDLT